MADQSAQTAFLQSLFKENGVGADPTLNAFQKTVAQNDYWRQAAAPVLGAQFDRSTWTPTQNIGVSAAQSFIGSLLNSLGANSEAKQLQSAAAILPQLYADPNSVAMPEGMDAEAFAGLQLSAARENMLRNVKAQETAQALKANVFGDLFSKGLAVNPDTGKIEPVPGIAKGLGDIERQKEEAKWGAAAGLNPDSPQAKEGAKIIGFEDAMRKEIGASKPATAIEATLAALPKLQEYAQIDSKTADIPFVYAFVQAQDGGVVKEGEIQMTENASPVLIKFQSLLNGALNGTSTLTVAKKQQMLNEMKLSARNQWETLKTLSSARLATATERGAKAENVLPYNDESMNKILGPRIDPPAADLPTSLKSVLDKVKSGQVLSADDEALIAEARKQATGVK